MKTEDDSSQLARRVAIYGFLAASLLVTAHAVAIAYLTWPISEYSVEKAASIGDTYGWLTSFFSGLAFVGLIVAILLPRDELQLQRKELSLTRDEMTRQNFEATFFQMLRLHNDIVTSIDLTRGRSSGATTEIRGRDCFVTFYTWLRGQYSGVASKMPNAAASDVLKQTWADFWKQYQTELGHYFRFLYTTVKFVKNSDAHDKRLYTNIVRAQLSDADPVLQLRDRPWCGEVQAAGRGIQLLRQPSPGPSAKPAA